MSTRTPFVIALVLMGRRPEPFLPAVLKSLDAAVDLLVVNDNSGDPTCVNRRALEASALFASGRAAVFESEFVNFSQARNQCLAHVRDRLQGRPDTWLLQVDCDEVHADSLPFITRNILKTLAPGVGVVDGYFVQFMLSYELYNSLDRRHNLLVRYNPSLHYTHLVHEQLQGVEGRRLCLPYTFYHYGYVRPAEAIVNKWRHYLSLGDHSYSERDLDEMKCEKLFERELDRIMYYAGDHPSALASIGDDLHALQDPALARFHDMVAARMRDPVARSKALCRHMNFRLRLWWRMIQCLGWTPRLTSPVIRMTVERQTTLAHLLQRVASV